MVLHGSISIQIAESLDLNGYERPLYHHSNGTGLNACILLLIIAGGSGFRPARLTSTWRGCDQPGERPRGAGFSYQRSKQYPRFNSRRAHHLNVPLKASIRRCLCQVVRRDERLFSRDVIIVPDAGVWRRRHPIDHHHKSLVVGQRRCTRPGHSGSICIGEYLTFRRPQQLHKGRRRSSRGRCPRR